MTSVFGACNGTKLDFQIVHRGHPKSPGNKELNISPKRSVFSFLGFQGVLNPFLICFPLIIATYSVSHAREGKFLTKNALSAENIPLAPRCTNNLRAMTGDQAKGQQQQAQK